MKPTHVRRAHVLCANCGVRWQLWWPGRVTPAGAWDCAMWLEAECPGCGSWEPVMFTGWAGEPVRKGERES